MSSTDENTSTTTSTNVDLDQNVIRMVVRPIDECFSNRPMNMHVQLSIQHRIRILKSLSDRRTFVALIIAHPTWTQVARLLFPQQRWCDMTQFSHRAIQYAITYEGPEQGSQSWLAQREMFLTGSIIYELIGPNARASRRRVFREKVGIDPRKFFGNEYTRFGTEYEDEAICVYRNTTDRRPITNLPLIRHRTIPFLAASPDFITRCGRAGEVKCPPRRQMGPFIPEKYYPQVQLVMEVCDLEVCDFVQYRPSAYGEPYKYICVEVTRNREWFARVLPVLSEFHEQMVEYRKTGNIPEEYRIPTRIVMDEHGQCIEVRDDNCDDDGQYIDRKRKREYLDDDNVY